MSELPRTVGDVMTRPLIVLREEDNLSQVLEGMRKFHIHHIPVVDGDKLVGMLSHRDVLAAMQSVLLDGPRTHGTGVHLEERTFVAKVMTRAPVTVRSDTPIAEALERLLKERFGALPVVDDDLLVGILTDTDLLRVLQQMLAQK